MMGAFEFEAIIGKRLARQFPINLRIFIACCESARETGLERIASDALNSLGPWCYAHMAPRALPVPESIGLNELSPMIFTHHQIL